MLVLDRKVGQKFMIEGDITITVLGIDRGRVKLGIEAPSHIKILREELKPPLPPKRHKGSCGEGTT